MFFKFYMHKIQECCQVIESHQNLFLFMQKKQRNYFEMEEKANISAVFSPNSVTPLTLKAPNKNRSRRRNFLLLSSEENKA